MTLTEILVLGHFSLNLFFGLRVIYSRRSTGSALGWLVLLFALPYLGTVLYLLIGEPRLGRQRMRRVDEIHRFYGHYTDHLMPPETTLQHNLEADPRFWQIALLGKQCTHFAINKGNQIRLLETTDEIIDSMLADINRAKHTCLLMFYIVDAKGRAEEVLQALIAAARRGVRCQLMVDDVGSQDFLKSDWPKKLQENGIAFTRSLTVRLWKTLFVRGDLRNHRKLLVVDHSIAYTGSYNLVDPRYFKQNSGVGEWVDVFMRCEGPVATSLSAVFYADWAVETQANFDATLPAIETYVEEHRDQPQEVSMPGEALLQVIPSAPDQGDYVIYETLVCAVYGAQQSIVVTTPYFVPDETLLMALTSAARRGVKVTLIMPKKGDSWLVNRASKAYYSLLLDAGVNLAMFCGGLLHSKTVVIDDKYALFGTVNMDMRSFYLNMELSLAVYDSATVKAIVGLQNRYLLDCEPVELKAWQHRPRIRRFVENCVRLISPLL